MPSKTPYNWFFKKMDNGQAPPDAQELSFINKYSVRWVDRDADENDKVIYLTFDVGYENGNVAKVLDALKEKNAVGTFFILENVVFRNPDLVRRMNDEGHVLGNHTAKHPDMSKICDKAIFKKQLTDLEECCRETLGIEVSKYFRPPEGKFDRESLSYLCDLGYKTVFWSFAYADWDNNKQPSVEWAKRKILDNIHNGEIMLLHPTSDTNATILKDMIVELKNGGFKFGTLDELYSKER
jgi:peptidoglycan-N-acetylmuramic acid deacetylase